MQQALDWIPQGLGLAIEVENTGVGSEESIEHVVGKKPLLWRGQGRDEVTQLYLESAPSGNGRLAW